VILIFGEEKEYEMSQNYHFGWTRERKESSSSRKVETEALYLERGNQ